MRLRPLSLALATLIATSACQQKAPTAPVEAPAAAQVSTAQADAKFADLSKRWLDGSMELQPVAATQTGNHAFDDRIDDLSAAGRQKLVDFSTKMLAELDALDLTRLSRDNQVDALILRNQIRYDIWTLQTLQSWAWDPQVYNSLAGGALYTLMARDFAPMPQRLKAATARMEKIPALFQQMRENIDPARVPAIHAETVKKQHAGIMSIVDSMIVPEAKALSGADRTKLDAAVTTLRTAAAEHQKWLDETLVPNAKGDFRIGQQLYDEKLAFALNSPMTRQDIRQRAEAAITETRKEMYDISRKVLAGKPGAPASMPDAPSDEEQQKTIEAALELAYADRPARDKVVELAKASTAEATKFAREKDLVTVPDTPVQIILMPEFQRGVSVAYCDSPGPLDKGLDTFYAVSPIPDDWTPAQVDSFLREYNTRSIHELSIHEAMPGHYLQIAHANKHPSVLRAVLGSGSFIEGWAMYAEKVMADAGYMDNDPLMQLIQRKWALRAFANAILDQAIHVDGMSEADAMKLMTVTTFQQEREAAGKWTRARLTSAQLPTYFVGYAEHLDLRREMEKRDGAKFNLKAFHDKVLSFGSPPGRFARQLMLDEPIK
ncbi:DUF885 domain-containing protein [Agrilutibacter solisilvae]|uniref:DUF885 domain-containing protein n=1 Tax=Agrilutibacter solisilvae TaxID=2763317 RepID=A0A974XY13_9GAMM|nr:DUF885 domain-containing protein [Lysobacter solisilvae]QSX76998.1 DUF885 domain-containing protein [Lysobacter solisilvae]